MATYKIIAAEMSLKDAKSTNVRFLCCVDREKQLTLNAGLLPDDDTLLCRHIPAILPSALGV